MIPQQLIEVSISNNAKFYKELGFGDIKQGDKILVDVFALPKKSNKVVKVICDACSVSFERDLQNLLKRETHFCYDCSRKSVGSQNKGNTWGFSSLISGEKHPRYNKQRKEYSRFAGQVHHLSSKQPLHLLENNDKPRGINGVVGAYQLDHITPISKAFEMGWSVEQTANINNLRFIPWEENLKKSNRY